MPRIRVYPYKQGSRSASVLAEALGGRVIKIEGSTFVWRESDICINWGTSRGALAGMRCRVLNEENAVRAAANKLNAFGLMKDARVSIPLFAETREDVAWEGMTVVRHKLTGHSGEGIELVEAGRDLPAAPLYVQYIPKKEEYRVHVIGQSIIAVQRKALRNGTENPNYKIRNLANGFVFVRENVNPPEEVLEQAIRAMVSLGLDFGAADIIYSEKQGRAYVLEVNTAPGLEGQTIEDYANGFREFIRNV